MKNFAYSRAENAPTAVNLISQNAKAKFLGGGTNLVDLMRENIEQPDALVDVTGLPFNQIEELADGGISIGAAVKNSALANHRTIRERYPFLAQAILFGASGQIRNMATVGGNLMQRTRCFYFYDEAANCNKRRPNSGCDAIDGFNRMHAIGKNGKRAIPFNAFHRLPENTPHIETDLQPDELITSIQVPALGFAKNSLYRKLRDRASYAFALLSVAAALEVENGIIKNVRLALGGVAHKPWRAFEAETALAGVEAKAETFSRAAEAELANAKGFAHNRFKIELAKRTIVSVLSELAEKGGAR